MKAVFKRELKAYFTTPLGYVIIAIMMFFLGQVFSNLFAVNYGNIAYAFVYMNTYAMLIAPIITMKLFSEEKRQKTDQLLFTSPVKIWKTVAGKFLAAFCLFMLGYAITLVQNIIFASVTEVNWLLYISCILGAGLVGASIISIGIFISSSTESQIISAILSMIVSLALLMIDFLSSIFNNSVVTAVCDYISVTTRLNTFASGIIDFSNVVFFLSITALFLFLTTRSIERKRWA